MEADFETTGGLLRLFEDGKSYPDDDYLFCMTIVGDEGVATIKGLVAEGLPASAYIPVGRVLRRAGFEQMRWVRHKPGGRRRTIVRDLRKARFQ